MDALLSFADSIVHHHTHHAVLKLVRSCIVLISAYLSALAAFIIILAALYGIIKFIFALIEHRNNLAKRLPSFARLRVEMGSVVALALQLLVAADVLETLTQVTPACITSLQYLRFVLHTGLSISPKFHRFFRSAAFDHLSGNSRLQLRIAGQDSIHCCHPDCTGIFFREGNCRT